jgi:hypothetical protein
MDQILKQLAAYYSRIQTLLEKEHALLSKKSKYAGVKMERRTGLAQLNSGIFVPGKAIAHRVMYEAYEAMLVETFLGLVKSVVKCKTEKFVPFSYRTIIEIGTSLADVVFSKEISDKDKVRLKGISLLTDYASVVDDPILRRQYEGLLSDAEISGVLKPAERELYESALSRNGRDTKLVKRMRRLYSDLVSNLRQKVTPIPFGNPVALIAIHSGYSHMLHGNLFFLQDFVKREYSWRNELWAYAMPVHAGQNLAFRVADFLGDNTFQSEIVEIQGELKEFWPKMGAAWAVAIKKAERT